MADMTVLEFAVRHAEKCTCGTTDRAAHIASDVDGLIEAAVALKKVLWNVGFDGDGNPSLIWLSYPEEVWTAMLAAAVQLQGIKRSLGLNP